MEIVTETERMDLASAIAKTSQCMGIVEGSAGAYTASDNALRGRGSGHTRLISYVGELVIPSLDDLCNTRARVCTF